MAPATDGALRTEDLPSAAVHHACWLSSKSLTPAASQCETEIVALMRDLDALQKQYNEGLNEIHSLKTTLAVETKHREDAETTYVDLEREKQRLMKAQLATYERASKQLDYATKYENSMQLLKAANEKAVSKDKENHEAIVNANIYLQEYDKEKVTLCAKYEAKVDDLYRQIMELRRDIDTKEQSMVSLQQQLALSITPTSFREKLQEAQKQVHDSYQDELEELRNKLKIEEMNSRKFHSQLQEAQQSLMTSKVRHDDQLRELSANRHADIFKQKVMKLRKDNEILRRQLQQNLLE